MPGTVARLAEAEVSINFRQHDICRADHPITLISAWTYDVAFALNDSDNSFQ